MQGACAHAARSVVRVARAHASAQARGQAVQHAVWGDQQVHPLVPGLLWHPLHHLQVMCARAWVCVCGGAGLAPSLPPFLPLSRPPSLPRSLDHAASQPPISPASHLSPQPATYLLSQPPISPASRPAHLRAVGQSRQQRGAPAPRRRARLGRRDKLVVVAAPPPQTPPLGVECQPRHDDQLQGASCVQDVLARRAWGGRGCGRVQVGREGQRACVWGPGAGAPCGGGAAAVRPGAWRAHSTRQGLGGKPSTAAAAAGAAAEAAGGTSDAGAASSRGGGAPSA